MQQESIFELKQQARRLRDALAELGGASRGLQVSHVESLNLVARCKGFKTWEALESLQSPAAPQASMSAALPTAKPPGTRHDDAWANQSHPDFMAVHSASLARGLDYGGYTSADLEAVTRKAFDAATASELVRAGYLEQVKALLAHHMTTVYRGKLLPVSLARRRVAAQLAQHAPGRRAKPHAYGVKKRTWWMGQLAQELERQGFEPADLDGLVYDLVGGKNVSNINNKGLESQLMAIFDALRKSSKELDVDLRDQLLTRVCAECADFKATFEFRDPPLGQGY